MPSKKSFVDKLSTGQKVTLVAAILGGCCLIVAAVIGLGTPILNFLLEKKAQQDVLATPTYIPPTDSVELPMYQSEVLSAYVTEGDPSDLIDEGLVGLVAPNVVIDHNNLIEPIKADSVIPFEDLAKVTKVNSGVPPTIWVVLTGKSNTESVQLSNRVAVKLVSYEKIPDMDLVRYFAGGPRDTWLVAVDLSPEILFSPNDIAWATYTPDLRSRLLEMQQCCSQYIADYPNEILKAISSSNAPFPDYFLLENNEKIVFSVAPFFSEPGIYQLQFGIEYIYSGYKSIGWVDPPVLIYVMGNYYLWSCESYWMSSDGKGCLMMRFCEYSSDGFYTCTEK